jgi:anti-sigma factor RsiW
MCPDRQIISLYVDGELPSPWDGKMETHLESCEKCRSAFTGYRNIKKSLLNPKSPFADDKEKTLAEAQERVWQKLTAPGLVVSREPRKTTDVNRIWSRNITLPIPVVAAAMVFIIFFVLVGIRGLSRPIPALQEPAAASGIGLNDNGIVNIQDMAGVLQYLSNQDNGDFMVIRLPESRTFSRIGEPALINAADYSRRGLSR